MKVKMETRRITSLLAGLTLLVVALTGILLFLHLKTGSIASLHKWLGLCFLAAAMLHLTINWRAFASYLKHRAFWVGVVVVVLVCALVLTMSNGNGKRERRGYRSAYSEIINR